MLQIFVFDKVEKKYHSSICLLSYSSKQELGLFADNPEPGLLARISDLFFNKVTGVGYPDKQNLPNITVKPRIHTQSLNETVNLVKSRIDQVRL